MGTPSPVKLYEPLPVAPGTSGMHLKGLAYRGICEFARNHVPGGVEAVSRCFASEALRDFCLQPFMAASLYDVLPIQSMVAAVAHLLQVPFEVFVREGSRRQAGFDCATVYKHLIAERDPGQTFVGHTRIGLRYYDFLDIGTTLVGPRQGHLWISGMPRYLMPWFLPMQEAYSTEVMRVAGAQKPRLTSYAPRAEGSRGKLPLVRIEFDAHWT